MKTPIVQSKDLIINQINESLKGSVKTHALNAIKRLCENDKLIPLNKYEVWRMRGIGKIAINFFEKIGVVEKPIREDLCCKGLSIRASWVLEFFGIKTPEEAAEKIKNNQINLMQARGCGKKTSREICCWAGLPEFLEGNCAEVLYVAPLREAMRKDFQEYITSKQTHNKEYLLPIKNVENVLKQYFIFRRKIEVCS